MGHEPLAISNDLTLAIGAAHVKVSPSEGLRIAEELARKSFRRALVEECAEVIGDLPVSGGAP